MNNDYLEREKKYFQHAQMPQVNPRPFPGFTLYAGHLDAPHFILGEDHSDGAILAIMNALRKLVIPGKTVITSEGTLGGRNGVIKNEGDRVTYRQYLNGWQHHSIEFLLSTGTPLHISDSSTLLRRSVHSKNNVEELLRQSKPREFRTAQKYVELTKKHPRVIGIYGSLHAISPIFDQVLRTVPHTRLIYSGIMSARVEFYKIEAPRNAMVTGEI